MSFEIHWSELIAMLVLWRGTVINTFKRFQPFMHVGQNKSLAEILLLPAKNAFVGHSLRKSLPLAVVIPMLLLLVSTHYCFVEDANREKLSLTVLHWAAILYFNLGVRVLRFSERIPISVSTMWMMSNLFPNHLSALEFTFDVFIVASVIWYVIWAYRKNPTDLIALLFISLLWTSELRIMINKYEFEMMELYGFIPAFIIACVWLGPNRQAEVNAKVVHLIITMFLIFCVSCELEAQGYFKETPGVKPDNPTTTQSPPWTNSSTLTTTQSPPWTNSSTPTELRVR